MGEVDAVVPHAFQGAMTGELFHDGVVVERVIGLVSRAELAAVEPSLVVAVARASKVSGKD